jgi:putative phage-type endonuclease
VGPRSAMRPPSPRSEAGSGGRAVTQDLGDRTKYLGASDIAAIIGVSPYCSPIELWQQKVGLLTVEESDFMRAGTVLEDSIVTLYEQRYGYRTQRRNLPYVHDDHPFVQGHVDRIVVGEPGLMDAKASAYGPGYGEPETDQVPPHIRVQMTTYTGLTGRGWADVALLRNLRLDRFRVEHDGTLYAQLVGVAVDFWHEHVIKGIPPQIDGTEEYRRYIGNRFPVDDGTEMVATPELALLVEELAAVQAEGDAVERREELVKNRLRDAMGAATTLLAPGGKVTWKRNKDSVRVDWQLVAEALRSQATADEWRTAVDVATRTTEGARVFRFAPSKAALEEAA